MLYHIARWRMTVIAGVWNEDLDAYEPIGDRFTVILKRDRLFSTSKETPLDLGGRADVHANMDKLIAHVNERFNDLNVHVRYGTLDEYFRLLNREDEAPAGKSFAAAATAAATAITGAAVGSNLWPTYGGDFFPLGTNNNIYSDQPKYPAPDRDTEYWTG